MWKLVDGKLIQTTDESRVKFRTNISEGILLTLKDLALENKTHVNYLIENGLKTVLSQGHITFNKDTRPKDRIQYKTTYDKELLDSLKEFAKKNNLFMNDVIEYSIQFIETENVRNNNYRYRIE